MQRLLRVAAARNRLRDYTLLRTRILKSVHAGLKERCREDGISLPAVIEALARGFVRKHPSALELVEQWVREEGLEPEPQRAVPLHVREIAMIYAAIGDPEIKEDEGHE
jgi:hypothetical protein